MTCAKILIVDDCAFITSIIRNFAMKADRQLDFLEALWNKADRKAEVVMCTSLKDETLLRQDLSSGALGHIVKPFRSEEMIAMIHKYIPDRARR